MVRGITTIEKLCNELSVRSHAGMASLDLKRARPGVGWASYHGSRRYRPYGSTKEIEYTT